MVKRFEVYLVDLDPTKDREMKKNRPCLVISPDEMNSQEWVIIIAPLTSTQRSYPTRIPLKFQEKKGDVALEYLRSVDPSRLVKKLGQITNKEASAVSSRLQELFAL